ncbi:MAG TPA: hypothetical protein VMR39_17195, partial [Sphingobium sp.]|nr:hypothetical protein [Sphingobium sp.]
AAGVFVCVLILAFVNSLVHAGDGWTAVVPMGLTISAATFVLHAAHNIRPGLVPAHGSHPPARASAAP